VPSFRSEDAGPAGRIFREVDDVLDRLELRRQVHPVRPWPSLADHVERRRVRPEVEVVEEAPGWIAGAEQGSKVPDHRALGPGLDEDIDPTSKGCRRDPPERHLTERDTTTPGAPNEQRGQADEPTFVPPVDDVRASPDP
jgi:hypothetical protein